MQKHLLQSKIGEKKVSNSYHATKGAEMRSKHMLQSCKAATQQDSPGETYTFPSTICWDLLGLARHFPEQILHSTEVEYSCNCVYGLNSVKTWCLGVSTCATCCMCILNACNMTLKEPVQTPLRNGFFFSQ